MFIRELFLIVFIAVGGIGASQIPQFVQEYEQRLGGAVTEATAQIAGYIDVARKSGLTFDAYLDFLIDNPDERVANTGRLVRQLKLRAETLSAHAETLADAGRLMKPVVLARDYDSDLLEQTWALYRITLLLDSRFGLIGLVVGWLLHMALWAILAAMFAPSPSYYRRR